MNTRYMEIHFDESIREVIWHENGLYIIDSTTIWNHDERTNQFQSIHKANGYLGSKIYNVILVNDIFFIKQGIVDRLGADELTRIELIALNIKTNEIKYIFTIEAPATRMDILQLSDKILLVTPILSSQSVEIELRVVDAQQVEITHTIRPNRTILDHYPQEAQWIEPLQCILLQYRLVYPPDMVQSTYLLWNYEDNTLITFSEVMNIELRCLALSPDGTQYVSGNPNKFVIRKFENNTIAQALKNPDYNLNPHFILWLESNLIVTMSNMQIVVWNGQDGTLATDFELPVKRIDGVAYSPNGQLVAITENGYLFIWELSTGELKAKLQFEMWENESWLEKLRWNNQSNKLAGIGTSGDLKIWNLSASNASDWYLEANYYDKENS